MDWFRFFFLGWGSTFSAYVILQALVLIALRRAFWYLALVPIPIMLWVGFETAKAWRHHSNLWPLLMIFASPIAGLYVFVLGMFGVVQQSHPNRRTIISLMVAIAVAASLPNLYMYAVAR